MIEALGIASLILVAAFTWITYRRDPRDGMGQTRRQSLIEAWVNITIGFGINYLANLFILPVVGASFTLAENFWLGWMYTAVSVVRQYAIRRYFNAHIHDFAARAAGGR